jgi:hypothetical protein
MLYFLFLFSLNLLISCSQPHYVSDNISYRQRISVGCKLFFKKENLCLKTKWETFPTEEAMGTMLLSFSSPENPQLPLSPINDPSITLWMPSMGHGSSPVTVRPREEGIYEAQDIFFIMPGEWNIKFQLKEGNEVIEEVIQNIII